MIEGESKSKIYSDSCFHSRTFRSFAEYALLFGYAGKEHTLKDKRILEVGAGDSNFAEVARQYGAYVVQLDPTYSPNHPLHPVFGQSHYPVNQIAGLVQELPFADNVFDEVVASFSVCHTVTKTEDGIHEMLRVARPNGLVKVTPVYPSNGLIDRITEVPNIDVVGRPNEKVLVIQKEPGEASQLTGQTDAVVQLITGKRVQIEVPQ